jgi:hypothetical protein
MSRSLRTLGLCVLLLAAGDGLRAASGRAQSIEGLLEAPKGFEATPEELEAFWSLSAERMIRARELATKVLEKNPSSYVGHLVMGEVEHDAEANFPRAVFHLERALALFEQRHGRVPRPDAPWRFHTRILLSLSFAYGDIEQHDKKLALLARYNEIYEPDRLAERAWPLMKLRKYVEARAAAKEGLATGDPRQREIALNALCAVEFEAGNDLESYEACKRAMDNAKSLGADLDPADLMNFAEASRSVFKLDEAERVDREATEASVAWYGNPFSELAELYTREGRFAEALASLKEISGYRMQRPPHVRESDRNENRRALSAFFVVMGRPEDALRITNKALVSPDRRGHNSRDPAQDLSVAALLDRSSRILAAERRLETAVHEAFYVRLWARCEALYQRLLGWMSGRRAVRAVSDRERLVGTFRIGTAQAAVMPPWLAGELVHALGSAPARAALSEAQKGDKRPQASAYYAAFEGEAAFVGGDDDALRLLSLAAAELPAAEALLRARVLALLYAEKRARGDVRGAVVDLERALQLDPGVLRRLRLRVPVELVVQGDAVASEVEDGLERSPRLDVGEAGLRVSVRADRSGGEACLVGTSGALLACGRAEAKSNEDAAVVAAKILDAFHERAFAPGVDLSQADASSLDGSNLKGTPADLSPLLEGEL